MPSLDGTFSCDSALERLLARCPALRSDPKLSSFSLKGAELTEDDVVGALAEPFLHPRYTIPIMGCFRPVNARIIKKAVALLQLVPKISSPSRGPEAVAVGQGEEAGEGDVRVIEFYVAKGDYLRLHELACLAFCRALDLAPFLLPFILNYFKFSPPPYKRFLTIDLTLQLPEQEVDFLLTSIRVSFRYIIMEPRVFSELWNWSCLLDIVHNTEGCTKNNTSVLDIRWCCAQILSVVLRMSDRVTERYNLREDDALACFLRWEQFCQDAAIEKAGWYIYAEETETRAFSNVSTRLNDMEFIGTQPALVTYSSFQEDDANHQSLKKIARCDSEERTLFLTSGQQKSYEMALMAVSQKWPVLIYGPSGVGKTALIDMLSVNFGSQVLFIHMDEQMDSKTLIGSYVCSEQPGQFKWQPGSLTQAVLKGLWVVFEEIDKAPSEIHSILLPLLEGSSSFTTTHGEEINVAGSFRLFSTVTSSKHDILNCREGSALWRKVMVRIPSSEDLVKIVDARYPCLKPISMKLIETFQKVNASASNLVGGFHADGIDEWGRFSLRHLLKWCRRISFLGCTFSCISLSASDCRNIYLEAVDIFASLYCSLGSRLIIMKEIASVWSVPMTQADNLHYHPSAPLVQRLRSSVRIGRVDLQNREEPNLHYKRRFINLRSSLYILEKIACSVKCNEPVLLVGETGTGKTTLVQNLALWLGQPLTVLNLSQQSDVADLVGGFKPADAGSICIPLHKEFKELFRKTISQKDNEDLLHRYEMHATQKKWNRLLKALQKCVNNILVYLPEKKEFGARVKRKRWIAEDILERWKSLSSRLESAYSQINSSSGMTFSFVEGAFVNAMKNGHWILLDEVNLAPPETLQRIVGVLDGDNGTLCLAERGDFSHINRHSCFRIFACMNPATDAGKRDLPLSLRSRFTEYFVDDVLDDDDLTVFVRQNMSDSGDDELIHRIVSFYKAAKTESEVSLQDSANQKPHFSLRSLARALEYVRHASKKFGCQRALYDGFGMFFLTLLDEPSRIAMKKMMLSRLLHANVPPNVPFDSYITRRSIFDNNYIANDFVKNYVLTRSVKEHLGNIARAVFIKRYPVLLQGPTSSGKTSLVQYLAYVTGHEFVRINNHEHTDLQEYLGTYITNSNGRLEYQEGALVKAVRRGCWIVLDELNLAPSDVLEALNRLLDDNRELYVPELQETISAHTDFMLFATQNPPTLYGGRKMLSRAFRNRFLEIHVDEIPDEELSTILEERCKIPRSYAQKMVDVSKDLHLHRQKSKVFAGKHGFITPRDLFKWADRYRMFGKSQEDLIRDGYLLLAERLRDESEKHVLFEVFKKIFREKHLDIKELINNLYCKDLTASHQKYGVINQEKVIWTKSMERLFFLVERCYQLREPVLLIGETGGGKTTVCQVLSEALGLKLHILNCHQYTETSDFLGGYHPLRDRSRVAEEFRCHIQKLKATKIFLSFAENHEISSGIEHAASTLNFLNTIINRFKQSCGYLSDFTNQDIESFQQLKDKLLCLHKRWLTMFIWQDGPLVQAMKVGDLFLVDEISLADDSVLERLNSVLEPERTLSLAEKGGSELETITAHSNFFILATMNPGGDYGKKELSPALRNRFTEIWVPPVMDAEELKNIVLRRLDMSEFSFFVKPMLQFWEWFNQMEVGRKLTVRDLLSWVSFINETGRNLGPSNAFIHGAFLVLLDGLNLGMGISGVDATQLRMTCFSFLLEHLEGIDDRFVDSEMSNIENFGWGNGSICIDSCLNDACSQFFGMEPFYIKKGPCHCEPKGFEFMARTTCRNALRVLRAMQLTKPVLLEGSPGVGKTSLVVALAKYSGHTVVRINLSEQTDMMDLLGSDLPTNSADKIEFSWSDGILLQAIKDGSWVLLDELNLAPQSVLEGLNAILDHRAEVYIPELNQTFKCPPSFRIFACQNPFSQGGGRKGLPKSFLNRFTKVYIDELLADDYLFICHALYPQIPIEMLRKLIRFNCRVYEDTVILHRYGQNGAPWEFNLRDVIRSCQLIEDLPPETACKSFLNVIYYQRLRTASDRRALFNCFEEVFGVKPDFDLCPRVYVNPYQIIAGSASLQRNNFQPSKVLGDQLVILPQMALNLEALLHCMRHQWLCILVGPSSSGKTSMIRWLAQATGNSLNELSLSAGTDVSELLGCFAQYNAMHTFQTIMQKVENYIYEYCSLQLLPCWGDLLNKRKSFIDGWLAFLAARNSGAFSSMSVFLWNSYGKYCKLLADVIMQLKLDLEKYQLPVSWSLDDLDRSLKTVLDLQNSNTTQKMARFEWVSGGLIKAIECGEWVVLDNANLCNPTVLDRINSLVEPSGLITVSECGLVDGKPLVLRAHPNFRMFLTVDPKYGEVSRAMRNRGVEIFMMEPALMLEDDNGSTCRRSRLNDVKRFLVASGIPSCNLIDSMAEAHLYAKEAGSQFGVDITFLELTRWVQLFQRLLMTGNHLVWSVQLSWEHTYLSSLGENNGKDIIKHGKTLLLSESGFYKSGASVGGSLSLPGGWPFPLRSRYSLWFPREVSIRKNCMLLEYLGAHCASSELAKSVEAVSVLNISELKPAIIPMDLLRRLLFPMLSDLEMHIQNGSEHFDLELTSKMLLIAGKWTIEQATANDIDLYLLLFEWYNAQLQPYCTFFQSFSNTLRLVRNHPIWNFVVDCWSKLTSSHHSAKCGRQVPLLSSELVNLAAPGETDECKELRIAISSANLLFLSFWQWNAEIGFIAEDRDLSSSLSLVLKSLTHLEKEVLNIISKSHYPGKIVEMYADLIDHHTVFWETITLSMFSHAAVAWILLKKKVTKFQPLLPEAVDRLLVDSPNLERFFTFSFYTSKPLLWLYGGHPLLPASSTVFQKLCQLSTFCRDIWPGLGKFQNHFRGDYNGLLDVAVSTVKELRKLVMEGVCMSSYISMNYNLESEDIIHQVGEIYENLLTRLECERSDLQGAVLSSDNGSSSCCCELRPESLCRKTGFTIWMDINIFLDRKSFYLDAEILEQLSNAAIVPQDDLYQVLVGLVSQLQSSVEYSLQFSSRCPIEFASHQKILWLLDAWGSASTDHIRISDIAHEMWFMWHSSLWNYQIASHKKELGIFVGESLLLLQPIRMATVSRMLQISYPLVDYDAYCLRLRVTSGILWKDLPSEKKLPAILLSMARSLFQQLIFVHKNSFEEETFGKIEAAFNKLKDNSLTEEMLLSLLSLMKTSNHKKFTSSIESLRTLFKELFSDYSSSDNLQSVGLGWLYLGVTRFSLLFDPCGLDPTFKYSFKLSHVHKKISLLELEKKVRQESEQLSGRSLMGNCLDHVMISIQHLKKEERRLKEKIVFRENPQEYDSLKSCCAEFYGYVLQSIELANHFQLQFRSTDLERYLAEACNWQVTATGFIKQLNERYTSFTDVTQPLRVAIYEMKMGLSLLFSSVLEKAVVTKAGTESKLQILATIHSLMSFPSTFSFEPSFMEVNSITLKPTCAISENSIININLLKKLIVISSENVSNRMISNLQLEASLHQTILHFLARSLLCSHVMDISAYMLLNEMFCYFTKLWMDWKNQLKEKDNGEAQDVKFKFRSREIVVEEFLGCDLSEFDSLNSNLGAPNNLVKELELKLSQEEGQHDRTETGYLESNDWNITQGSISENIVSIHNQLFGPSDLRGAFQVTDEKKLQIFLDSYNLGARIIEGLPSMSMSLLDDDLVPEHLLYVCLELQQISKPCHATNIYKDPNAPEVSKMVGPLVALRDRGRYLSEEWPGHPGLQTVLDLTEKLLKFPLTISLSEALFGLQYLYARASLLKESFPQFSFNDELLQVYALLTSWQKIELNSWPFVLAKVLERHEANATKFWFPLHLLLHRSATGDTDFDIISTIESLEDFIQTSSVGEFRKRIQLLLSFHGEIDANINLNSCLSPILKHTRDILYNLCGYYIQFLPLILKHIESSRKSAEQKLEEITKLVKWDENQISGFRGARHSFGKLVKNFNDVLQQPAIVFLNIEKSIQETKFSVWLEYTKGEAKKDIVEFPMDVDLWSDTRRSLWYGKWRSKLSSALQENKIQQFLANNDMESLIQKSLSPWLEREDVQIGWQEGWISLENICHGASKFVYIWKNMSKNFVKGRALPDFLKTLEQCGLSRHKSLASEHIVERSEQSRSYRQPSFCVEHLLCLESSSNVHLIDSSRQLETGCCYSEWHEANQYYFKNLAIMQLLRHIGLNFHKDFTPQQVKQAISFVDHLILIQQDQRSFTYGFYEQLVTLKRHLNSLMDFGNGKCSLTPMQNTILSYLWKQKNLFDNLLSLTKDISLYARCVRESHLNNCFAVVADIDPLESFIGKFVTRFIQAKEFLDNYLLGTDRIIPASSACYTECIITDNIKHTLIKNFETVRDFDGEIEGLKAANRSVKDKLLDRLKEQARNGMKMWKEFQHKMDISSQSRESCVESSFTLNSCDLSDFSEAYKKVIFLVMGALEKVGLICQSWRMDGASLPEEITSWKAVFESYNDCLQLNLINQAIVQMIIALRIALSKSGKTKSGVWSYLAEFLKHAYVFLDLLFCLANGIMSELLSAHKIVTEASFMLSHVFISLFSKGFGNAEEQSDETDCEKAQGATGTGMGEGEGTKDVSDQITDESQILGSSEKQMEDTDNADMIPNKKEKGIEMDEDFAAETFSVSEGSSGSEDDDDDEDDDNLNVESLMGENAEHSEAIRERRWDKEEDGNNGDSKDKYEQGAAVKETDPASKELRAKGDTEAAMDNTTADGDEFDSKEGEDEDISCSDDVEASNEIMDKCNAFEDPTGLQIEEQAEKLDELDIDDDLGENEETLSEVEADTAEADDDQRHPFDEDSNPNRPDMEEDVKTEETLVPVDDLMNEDGNGEGEDRADRNEGMKQNLENLCGDATKSSQEQAIECPTFDAKDNMFTNQSVMPLTNGTSNGESCVGPFSNIPSTEITKTDSSSHELKKDSFGSGRTDDELKKHSYERTMPNPYRSIGDALKDWKERVHIAPVSQKLETVASDNLNDETADEYQYISEMELGSSQALGPATSDQLVQNIVQNENDLIKDGEDHISQKDVDMADIVNQVSENECVRSSYIHMMQEQDQLSLVREDCTTEEIARDEPENRIEDRISFKRDFTLEKIAYLNKSNAPNHDVAQATDIDVLPGDQKNKAIAEWRRYEFVTASLSHELAEQLRLVMQPTLASKLQGDYKTGKRINMKKVIPYIASHFRKDKIWLRRTRPNKRDYQVVVAVDDSRSMSESHCGKVAIEALVTVCRAMSQLEVGQLAVTSFGEKGNIRLLHDFGQPFTSESGVKMVSSFSFEQDNTIADEPMVDLLKHLNSMLDSAVAKARLPSGNNPLQQLILIIADGRFHEKENLKRYVRNVLNRNRMVAFLLVDSPQESITNLMEASFQDGEIRLSEYLNSFPFPYYVVLNNIEALPRTLGDLLRQWFELMQMINE